MIRDTQLQNRATWPDENRGVPRRGRPRSAEPSYVVHVRLPQSVYDRYCQMAIRQDESVGKMVKRVVTQHQPCDHDF